MITASEAKMTSLAAQEAAIVKTIKDAAANGELKVTFPYLSDADQAKLTANGFVVEQEPTREGMHIIVKWTNA